MLTSGLYTHIRECTHSHLHETSSSVKDSSSKKRKLDSEIGNTYDIKLCLTHVHVYPAPHEVFKQSQFCVVVEYKLVIFEP